MHVVKVPVVHKFGIISHCQRLKLQSRLFEEIVEEKTDVSNVSSKANSTLFEVSDEFVENYNAVIASITSTKEMKREIVDKAQKIFNKIKRKVGLKYNCESEAHINLALGWTELSILSQCDGRIGQESMDLLLMSLNVASISNRAFSVLFYLLETVLYSIQVHQFDSNNPHKHVKWLLIGETVATRIYLQCSMKLSQCTKDKLENLTLYIKDFNKCLPQYDDFPELSISFCVIKEVTDYLILTSDAVSSSEGIDRSEQAMSFNCGSFLWHAVDLCRCFSYSAFKSQMQDCVNGIRGCVSDSSSLGEWIECYLAIRVVANAASFSESALEVYISIVRGLTDANHALTYRSSGTETNDEGALGDIERGTLLLMTAMREFATLPLVASNSVVREMALSTIAEMLLSKESTLTIGLPSKVTQCVVSRIHAILNICDQNDDVTGFHVVKNSIWCLIGAVTRKKVLSPKEGEFSERYGRILPTTLFSSDLHKLPQSTNNRISNFLIQYLLPVFPVGKEENSTATVSKERPKVPPLQHKQDKPRVQLAEMSKKKAPAAKRDSSYAKQADTKLKSILNNYWTQELPVLQKSLDDEESENTKK